MSLRISSKFLTADQMSVLLDKVRTDCERNIVTCRNLEMCFDKENQPCNRTYWLFQRRYFEHLLTQLHGLVDATHSAVNKLIQSLEKKENFYLRTPTPFNETNAYWTSLT